MTPDALRAALDAIGLPHGEVARCLGVQPRQLSEWCSGKSEYIPPLVGRVLTLAATAPSLLTALRQVGEKLDC